MTKVGMTWVLALALTGLGACSADEGGSSNGGRTTPTGGGTSGATTTGGGDANGPPPGQTTGDFGNSTGTTAMTDQVINQPTGEVTVEASYIWIANSAQGTVSKLDTRTMTELGRYLTSPNGTGLPSRTSVAESGNVAVANRGNATAQMAGDGGGITKIFANPDDCEDKNGNGTIDTSTGADDVRPWGEEECMAWHTPIQHFSNRPVQWAPAPAPDAPADLWTSGATTCDGPACNIEVFRLDGETGAIKDTVAISGLSGVDMITAGGIDPASLGPAGLLIAVLPPSTLILNYGAYGGVSDSGGNFWLFIANTTQLIRVDAVTLEWRQWPTPMGNGYGITIDDKGRIFVCGTLGVSRFDPSTQAWLNTWETGASIDLGYNGCMTDGAGTLWVGGGSDQGQTGLFAFDTETLTLTDQVNTDQQGNAMNVKGVSIDVDGKVWGVSSPGADMSGAGNLAWRFDPVSREVASYDGLEGAYSYSDMTGFGLKQAGFQEPPPLE